MDGYWSPMPRSVWAARIAVDVNEENAPGRKFYEALGFVLVGRSRLDDTGRPHPLLHLRREAPRAERAR